VGRRSVMEVLGCNSGARQRDGADEGRKDHCYSNENSPLACPGIGHRCVGHYPFPLK
jgi:hypothetical protein